MKSYLKTAALAAAMFVGVTMGAHSAAAQSTSLTLDVDQIYKDSVAAKSGSAQLNAKYSAELKTVQGALEAAAKEWNTQVEAAKKVLKPDGTLPPANQTAIDRARQNLSEAQGNFDQLRQEIQNIDQYIKYQILDKLVPIAEKIRKDRNGDVVLPRSGVLAADPVGDVTAAAMAQLNAALTVVSITIPQQQGAAPAAGAPAAATPAKPATTKPQPQSR
ncbi:MAG: OmpH family outer membrane protein [Sphingomonas sp.]|jgi:Skp family chaperone for outer membrane proteins